MDIKEDDSLDDLNSTLTEDSQLLETTSEKSEAPSEGAEQKLRYRELKKKLESTEEKIYKYEESISNISKTSSEVIFGSVNEGSKRNDYSQKTISNIQEYIRKLEEQFKELDKADAQVIKTTDRVLQEIDDSYDHLISNIAKEINKKRELMKLEAKVFKNESLVPLKACREEIHRQILKTKKSISTIESMKNEYHSMSHVERHELLSADRQIGGIPAVPFLDELPYLNFKSPSRAQVNELLNRVYNMGTILRLGPVQITDIEEKPGSVFVKWGIADPEYAFEDHIYVLQRALGEVLDPTSNEFTTIYEGSEESCFVKNVEINRPITLRVGIQSLESAWSSMRITKTSVPNYGWSLNNEDYMITNNGTVAAKINDHVSAVFSREALIDANQIIEFKFLEVPAQVMSDEGIALLSEPGGKNDSLRRRGSLMITARGKIFMDGEEKLMQLPSVHSGTRIIFTIARRDEETLRVNIECSDKAVTYYWNVETPLYFSARFLQSKKWNLMVK
ncbi:cytokine receptor-like factor 3 [Diachasma alloeum]|uniref:cytokine receptor-like factor 3 n=1 Tax=Diachasma alloeum TaxID=454923 RepID=UPI0007383177|nr:cytokine receptor-like factor 3 [Diachasma alloeum]XP_015111982.1 cytokine receptor-like factor 3 [Diachasma alloeum]